MDSTHGRQSFLKTEDVHIDDGILSIQRSKKDNSRLVPMSAVLTVLLLRTHAGIQDYKHKLLYHTL
jgi:hypothetical protein